MSSNWADSLPVPLEDPIDLLIEERVKLQLQLEAGSITQDEFKRIWGNVIMAATVLYSLGDLDYLETRFNMTFD